MAKHTGREIYLPNWETNRAEGRKGSSKSQVVSLNPTSRIRVGTKVRLAKLISPEGQNVVLSPRT